MDFIVHFFRDVLDGSTYIVVAVIAGILICSCIGYLAEQSLLKKKAKEEYDNTHSTVSVNNNAEPSSISQVQNVVTVDNGNVSAPSNVQDIQATISGIPTAVNTSQSLTGNTLNNSQNVVK